MLACLAEGRGRDRDDEEASKRGDAVTCELRSGDITTLMFFAKEHDKESAEQESTTGARARSARGSGHAKRITATTSLALRLAGASKSSEETRSVRAKNLLNNHRLAAQAREKDDAEDDEELRVRRDQARA